MTAPNIVKDCKQIRGFLADRELWTKRLSRTDDRSTQLWVAAGLAARMREGAIFRFFSISELMGYNPKVVARALLELSAEERPAVLRRLLSHAEGEYVALPEVKCSFDHNQGAGKLRRTIEISRSYRHVDKETSFGQR